MMTQTKKYIVRDNNNEPILDNAIGRKAYSRESSARKYNEKLISDMGLEWYNRTFPLGTSVSEIYIYNNQEQDEFNDRGV